MKIPAPVHASIRSMSVHFLAVICVLLSSTHNSHASDSAEVDRAWTALLEGTAVAIMRHALAPGTGDPGNFNSGDCSTQRNLSAEGRTQASIIGDMLRDQGLTKALVLTSEWCRCQETARLLKLGEAVNFTPLNSFFQNRSSSQSQTAQLKSALPDWLKKGSTPTVLVTHQVNISALTGHFTSSGEILIISLDRDNVVVLASIATPY